MPKSVVKKIRIYFPTFWINWYAVFSMLYVNSINLKIKYSFFIDLIHNSLNYIFWTNFLSLLCIWYLLQNFFSVTTCIDWAEKWNIKHILKNWRCLYPSGPLVGTVLLWWKVEWSHCEQGGLCDFSHYERTERAGTWAPCPAAESKLTCLHRRNPTWHAEFL